MSTRIQFTLPEHAAQARALGYACGLSTGIASPTYPHLPSEAPVKAAGPISTNDRKAFVQAFAEGHEPGFQFGSQAAQELAKVLGPLPVELWWPICMYFAGERITQESIPAGEDARIIQGVDAFRRIYQQKLL